MMGCSAYILSFQKVEEGKETRVGNGAFDGVVSKNKRRAFFFIQRTIESRKEMGCGYNVSGLTA